MSKTINVTVNIDPDEIKSWAEKHINVIPTSVAHVLFAAHDLYAGMKVEWGVTAQFGTKCLILSSTEHGNAFPSRGKWFPTKQAAEKFMGAVTATDPRLVHRHVTEVITDE